MNNGFTEVASPPPYFVPRARRARTYNPHVDATVYSGFSPSDCRDAAAESSRDPPSLPNSFLRPLPNGPRYRAMQSTTFSVPVSSPHPPQRRQNSVYELSILCHGCFMPRRPRLTYAQRDTSLQTDTHTHTHTRREVPSVRTYVWGKMRRGPLYSSPRFACSLFVERAVGCRRAVGLCPSLAGLKLHQQDDDGSALYRFRGRAYRGCDGWRDTGGNGDDMGIV
jgi:hypothetical protein